MIGSQLGPYRVERELGAGGMGVVYLATVEGDAQGLERGTHVAVKVVHPHLLSTPGFFKRFLREADIGKSVRHENVVRTFDVDATLVDGKQANYIVMEYVEGRTLRALLRDLKTVPEALLLELASQIVAGLAAIHDAGIIHRDMKPENVLVTNDHQVRIMDLGVARLQEATVAITKEGQFAGSLLYAAPEQFRHEGVGPATDLYALGIILYELASGANPFERDNAAQVIAAHLNVTPRPLREVNSQVSAFLGELTASLLAKAPSDRFTSATELRAVLREGESSAWWGAREKSVRERESRLPPIQVRRETALFGRENELALLAKAWEAAKAGHGNTVLIEGEAGIGKTRLVDAFLRTLEHDDAHVLYGAYSPTGGLGALSDALKNQFGATNLADALRPYLTVTPALVESFAALLRHDAPPTGAERLKDEAISAVFCHLAEALAREKPVVWVVDELHYSPDESRRLSLAMARALAPWRVLLVLAARPGIPEEEMLLFGRLDNFRRVPLSRLSPRQVVELLRDAFRSEVLAERLVGKIAFKSDGVPFFVFEIIRGLKDGSFIRQMPDGTFVESQAVSDIEVPSAVRDLVEARLAALTKDERAILDAGAVLGFEFDPDLVARVLEMKRIVLLQTLADVERRTGVIRASGRNYGFDHHQIQEVLYGRLAPTLREEYHAMLADAFAARERLAGAAPDEVPGEAAYFLALHGLGGSRPETALPLLGRGLAFLGETGREAAAIELCDRALTQPRLLVGDARLQVLLRKHHHLHRIRPGTEERALLDEATSLAETSADSRIRFRTLARYAWWLRTVGRLDEALAGSERALEAATATRDAALVGDALVSRSASLEMAGRWDEAREHVERALDLATRSGDARTAARRRGSLSYLDFLQGRFESSLAHAEAEYEAARAAARPDEVRLSLSGRGIALEMLGRWAESLRDHLASHELARSSGDRSNESVNRSNLALLYGALGDAEKSRTHAEQALSLSRVCSDSMLESYALHERARAADRAGRDEDAVRDFERALATRREIKYPRGIGETLLAWGRFELQRGNHERARAFLGEGTQVATSIGSREMLLCPAWLACVPGQDVAAARAVYVAQIGRLSVRDGMEAAFALGRASGDAALLAEARKRLDHLVEHAPAEYRETMIANVPLHRDIAAAAKAAGL